MTPTTSRCLRILSVERFLALETAPNLSESTLVYSSNIDPILVEMEFNYTKLLIGTRGILYHVFRGLVVELIQSRILLFLVIFVHEVKIYVLSPT